MAKAYYSLMQMAPTLLALILLSMVPSPVTAQQAPLKAASLESHEGLTVSAQPWTEGSQYKDKFPKKSPLAAGVIAVQVIFRNDTNESLRVNLERIRLTVQLSDENRQEVQSLTADQVADAVLKPAAKDPTKRSRLPVPLPTSKGGRDKHWTELQTEAQNAAVPTSVLAAHSSVQGLLYFDLQNQFDLLQSAHLYIPDVAQMDRKVALTYFDVDLGRRVTQ
jgi:hypothetical protein